MRPPILGSDALVKLLIQESGGEPFHQLQLEPVAVMLNVDLPRTQQRRVDLIYRTESGRLAHIEVQSSNDATMPLRMAEYGLAIMRMYGRYPQQVVLYVGNDPMRMQSGFQMEGMDCQYRLVDIRDFDGSALLASDAIADNIMAMLARLDDPLEGIRAVLGRIATLKTAMHEPTLELFLLACQMRGLEAIAIKEIRKMPEILQLDIKKWPFLQELLDKEVEKEVGEYRRNVAQKAREKGRQEGRREATKDTLLLALKRRFGRLPASVTKRVAALSEAQAQEMILAIIDAKSLKDLVAK